MRLPFALLCVAAVAYSQSSTPVISAASPSAIDAGGPAFTLTVSVSGAPSGAVVKWSGATLTTTFVDNNTLAATVPANLIAQCGKYFITVGTAQNNPVSAAFPVVVKPVLKTISPSAVAAGSAGGTIYATGLGFSSNVYLTLIASGVQSNLATTYGGPTALSAFVPASAFNGGYSKLSVFVTDPVGGVSETLTITIAYASVTAISPDRIYADIATYLTPGTSFALEVYGTNFAVGAQVLFNTTSLATAYASSSHLTATVPADLVLDASADGLSSRLAGIAVKNPGAGVSNALNFVIYPNPYGTTITSLSPSSGAVGGPALTLTVTGRHYTPASKVYWDRLPLATVFSSATKLTASLPASLFTSEGAVGVTVITPGVADSNRLDFTLVALSPSVSSISPTSASAGGPAFTLTVNGDGFILASQIVGLDGAVTTYVSQKQLTASVPASAIVTAGTHLIQVTNPGTPASQQVVVFTVKAPTAAPTLATLNPSAAAPGGAAFTLTVTGTGFAANSKVQWNGTALTTTFVSATQLTAAVPAALIATAGTAVIMVTGDGGLSNQLPFTIAAQGPSTGTAGILNAASSLPAIAPGTLIAIYGTNLAAATAQFSVAPLPVMLGNTSVSINGTTAPLLYVSPGQVNAQVPYEAKVGTGKLIVTANGVASPAVNFEVAATGPGVFTQPQTTHVLALNLADGTLNATATPAHPGDYVTAYLTGQGAVNPAATTGDVAPSSEPFARPTAAVVVKIGGQVASVPFAGLAPGFIGLMQMNVQIPDGTPAGEQAFDVSVGGVAAASTVISIAPKP